MPTCSTSDLRRPARSVRAGCRHRAASAAFLLSTLSSAAAVAQAQPGLVAITPCRLVDTRLTNAAYPFPYGGGPFTPWSKRTINVAGLVGGSNPCNGIVPAGGVVSSVMVKVTVVNPSTMGD